jgi:BirA family biotin operon repressor/biotin-[acetyl-CoA-carboxylase] ligase
VRSLVVLDSVDSTNDEARRLAAAGAEEGTVVIAERQTAGRGRQGRAWYSPPGHGLYLSVLLRPRRPAEEFPRWALAAAAAGCLAVREAGAAGAAVEWPNDIVCDGLKLGGTLVEARGAGSARPELVVGTGINLGHTREDFPPELRGLAGSVGSATGEWVGDRESLAASYLRRLGEMAAELAEGRFDPVRRAWLPLAPSATGRRVAVTPAGGAARFEGTTRGIDDSGALRVETDGGEVEIVRATGSVAWLRT